ncbi:hypothetical protein pb186bvf_006373 [Paramecium bursaria]
MIYDQRYLLKARQTKLNHKSFGINQLILFFTMMILEDDDQARTNYHEFMINQEQDDNSEEKIYTQKYFCLMIIITMMYLSSRFERNLLEYNSDVIYSIHISVNFPIPHFKDTKEFSWLVTLPKSLYFIYQIQKNLSRAQSYGFTTTPQSSFCLHKFLSKFVELGHKIIQEFQLSFRYLSMYAIIINFSIITQLVSTFEENMLIVEIIIVIVLIGNFVLILQNVQSYKCPSKSQIHKDFAKTITSLKVVIFTTLSFTSLYLNVSTNLILKQYQTADDEVYMSTSKIIYVVAFYLFLLFAFLIRNKKLQVDVVVKSTFLIQLILGLLVYFSLIPYDFVDIVQLIRLAVQFYQICFLLPQYQLILTSIGIKNLDFVSSLHTISKGIGISTVYTYTQLKYYNDDISYRLLISMIMMGVLLSLHLIIDRTQKISVNPEQDSQKQEQELSIQQN